MRFLKGWTITIIVCLCIFGFVAKVTAQSAEDQLKQKESEIKDLQAKLDSAKNQEKTLSLQISVMNNQIKLTQLRIESTKASIQKLDDDIVLLGGKIDTLEVRLKDVSAVLLNRIVVSYKIGNIDPLGLILTSQGFSDYINKTKYIAVAQEHDRKLLFELEQTKINYNNQKDLLHNKQEEQKKLQVQLEALNKDLAQQKKDKEALLVETKNNEAIYQQRLQAALAEQKAIAQLLLGGGNVVFAGKVKEGDTVGHVIIGASACSSGTHLHFEVHKSDQIVDPSGFLANKSVIFDNQPDGNFSFGGSWNWPLPDPIKIEQGYGMTHWARIGWYGGGIHTGIDMVSDSTGVKAVKDGELFRGSIGCGGGQLLFARVDQSDGMQTFYLHIVP